VFRKRSAICSKPVLKWHVSAQIGGAVIHGETKKINLSGAFIRCRNPLNLNEVFDMVVDTPEKPLNIRAEVIWSNIYGPDDRITPRGMGVRFVNISSDDRRLLARELGRYEIGKEACDFLDTLEIDLGTNELAEI
jgi:hypothetical protein